jgi:hypothetical protein
MGWRQYGRAHRVGCGVSQRLNAQIYVETIVQEYVVSFENNFGDDFILQQDNCRVHTANLGNIELSTRPRNSDDGVAGHESRSQSN